MMYELGVNIFSHRLKANQSQAKISTIDRKLISEGSILVSFLMQATISTKMVTARARNRKGTGIQIS